MTRMIMSAAVILLLLTASAHAEQKYNGFTNKWETVPDNSDWQTKYNAFDNSWSYQPKDAKTEYNAFENRWEWDSGHNPDE